MTEAYRKAASETLEILAHTDAKKVKCIPIKFINYLKENADKNYKVNLNFNIPINKMNIKNETKGILSVICQNWWWNDSQKQEYMRLILEKEKIKRLKYNPDDIFKSRKKCQ